MSLFRFESRMRCLFPFESSISERIGQLFAMHWHSATSPINYHWLYNSRCASGATPHRMNSSSWKREAKMMLANQSIKKWIFFLVCLLWSFDCQANFETTKREQVVAKGIQFLRQAQSADGSFSTSSGPGITGLVLHGLVASGLREGDATVDKAVKYLLSTRRDDGGI